MASSHFLRLASLSGNGKLTAAARHNKRTIQRELGAAGHIDPAKSALNYSLLGEPTPEAITAKAKVMREAAGVTRLRKNAVQAIEVIFSVPAHRPMDHRQYFTDCCEWIGQQLGAENILAADVHLDEAAPHLHVLLLPLKAGRMVGSELMGDRQTMQARQTSFYEAVAQRYGLPKPQTKRLSATDRQAMAKAVVVHLQANNDKVLKSALWAWVRDQVEQAPQACADCLGLELSQPAKPKKLRTMAEIFTSKGKGSKTEAKPEYRQLANPYRELSTARPQPLCSVGVVRKQSFTQAACEPETERVERESDQTEGNGFWDEGAGEWVNVSRKPQKVQIEAEIG